MTVAAILLGYAACAGTLGSRLLGRAGWTTRAPMLAIVTYLAAAWSVVASLGLVGLTLAVHATALGGGLSQLIGACVLRLRAAYATPGGATVAGLGLSLAGALLARTAITAAAHLHAVRQHAIDHAQAARMVGRRDPVLGAVLVDHAQPAAYCVGRPHPTVIVTTGAVRALDAGQLEAVLAHERAHLVGHHHGLLALARIGHRMLPFIPLMRDAATQVERLVEMRADDAATADRDVRPLVTALVVLATGAGPALGLAAAATDAVQRIQRLLRPAEPLSRARRGLLGAGAVAVALAPVLLALAPAVVALALGRVPAS